MIKPKVIVLTGGPGGGKTTIMTRLIQFLGERGVRVVLVPETATLLLTHGVNVGEKGLKITFFQYSVLATILHLEDIMLHSLEQMVKDGEQSILLCDRAALDCLAYVEPHEFQIIARELGTEVGELINRYDAVLHLRSAACGAEAHYTRANNPARTENESLARERDAKVQNAWCGHPHHVIIPAEDDFELKYKKTLDHVCNIIGIPKPLEKERKWKVNSLPDFDNFPVHYEVIQIKQHYLLPSNEGDEERVRLWSYKGVGLYFRTIKRKVSLGIRDEEEWRIGRNEYEYYLNRKDPDCSPIAKIRVCFILGDQRFELDHFVSKDPELDGLILLEAEVSDISAPIVLPPWLDIGKEVTGDDRYSNYQLSRFGPPKNTALPYD